MSEDRFAFEVDRLVRRHGDRLPPSVVAQVTLQHWLAMRSRFADPFDVQLFTSIDRRLARLAAACHVPEWPGEPAAPPAPAEPATRADRGPRRRGVSLSA